MPSSARTPQHYEAIGMLVVANAFWGLSFPLIKAMGSLQSALLPGASTWFVTSAVIVPRFALAALVVAAFSLPALRTMTRREWRQGLELGLFCGGGLVFQVDGLQYTAASTSAFLTSFYALLIPLWLALRTRRNPPLLVWASCALVIAGVAVLAQLDWRDLRIGRGEIETLVGSMFFAGQILCLDRPEFAGNRAGPITTLMFVTQVAVGLVLAAFTAPAGGGMLAFAGSATWMGFVVALVIVCTLGTFTVMNKWQPKITATEAGLIYCLEPVFASILALFVPAWLSAWAGIDYPNERATANMLLGGGLITAANVLLQLNPPAKPQPAA